MKRASILFVVILLSLVFLLRVEPTLQAAPQAQECLDVAITSPRDNAVVRGVVEITGSASIGDFNFYKVEYSGGRCPEPWCAISTTYSQPVIEGRLDVWDTNPFPDGTYDLRLTAVNNKAQEVCHTFVRGVQVANTQPSPTPTSEASPTPANTPTPRPPTPTIVIEQPTVVEETSPTPTGSADSEATPVSGSRTPLIPNPLDFINVDINFAKLGQAFVLGAGTSFAVFVLLGFLSLVRRLLS